jgi:putative ABC transport system permease protein
MRSMLQLKARYLTTPADAFALGCIRGGFGATNAASRTPRYRKVPMFKSYIASGIREFFRHRLHTTLSIAALIFGISGALLIGLFVQHQLSFDAFHPNADRIYRISSDYTFPGSPPRRLAAIGSAVAPLMKLEFPQVEKIARLGKCQPLGEGALISSGRLAYFDTGFAFAESELFEIFDFGWIAGSPATALRDPNSVVLTQSAAQRYFGSLQAVGETLRLETGSTLKVTGIVRDLPANTHFRFSMLASLSSIPAILGPDALNDWTTDCYYTYTLLRQGASINEVQRRAGDFYDRRFQPNSSALMGFTAIALKEIHLTTGREGEMRPPASRMDVYAFGAVAVLLLLITCMNYVNLATTRATQRATEVAVRKALGAKRRQLVAQFLAESMLMILIALICASLLVALALPLLNSYLGESNTFAHRLDLVSLSQLGAIVLLVGVAASSYPAFYLSAFKPAKVLSGDLPGGRSGGGLRKVLVTMQFIVSIGLTVATLVVYQQMRHLREIELGFASDQVVVLSGSPLQGLGTQWPVMRQQLLAHPEIRGVTASNVTPGGVYNNRVSLQADGDSQQRDLWYLQTDLGFFETYGIRLLAGRTFAEADRLIKPGPQNPHPKSGFILNETGARLLGWKPAEAIGKQMTLFGAVRGTVIGVARDVLFESAHERIKPTLYVLWPEEKSGTRAIREAAIRLSGRNPRATLDFIDATWARFVPEQPLSRRFLSQDLEALYRQDEQQAALLASFAALAIFIAALGILGLASFSAAARTREIGIRKALGGDRSSIVRLFTWEFIRLVLVASLIACPLVYLLIQRWLTGFEYRIDIHPLVFVVGVLLTLFVAWTTVAAVAIWAAQIRPSEALRHER